MFQKFLCHSGLPQHTCWKLLPCILYCVFLTPSKVSFCHHLITPLPSSASPRTFPSGNHHTDVCVYEVFVFCLIPSSFSPSPPPSVYSCQFVFCIYESVSNLFVSLFCLLDSTYKWNHMALAFSDWLISLSIILSRCIHAVAKGEISFFFTVKKHSIVYVYHSFFIHSSTDECLACFQILVIVNNTAMNIDDVL